MYIYMICIHISTTRPPFRIGYRRRSTTTKTPPPAITSINTSSRRPSSSAANTSSPRPTKLSRRKVGSIRTTSRPVESQVSTTVSPPRIVTSRYRFVSRKPYLKTSSQKRVSQASTDQTIESTNHQLLEEIVKDNRQTTNLADIALALQRVQQAPVPQAKPSKKIPQILRISSQYSSKIPASKPNASTFTINKESYTIPHSNNSQKSINKETIAITVPYTRGSYATPPPLTADRFITGTFEAAEPIIRELYSSPHSITANDYISKYTSLPDFSPSRSRVRYSTTNSPLLVITSGKATASKRRKQPQAFEKVSTASNPNNYKSFNNDYDYYDNIEGSVFGNIPEHSKVLLHGNGVIECLDQGSFPHPVSCKKFISCAKMDNEKIIGWEYTCPKNLSFDPIGGMCNWSVGLGCKEA